MTREADEPLGERLLTVSEVAAILSTSERFPRRLIAERRIRFVRVRRHVRIPESVLREFIAAGLIETITTRRRRRQHNGETAIRQSPASSLGSVPGALRGAGRIDRPAPQTFTSKGDAEIWLTMKEAEIRRGDWTDPEAGKVRFGDYASNWIGDHVFKPRTEGLYRSQLKNHLAPTFGKKDLRDVHEADVRRWRKERLDAGPHAARPFGPVTVAKTYRLLHAIMNTAVEDGLIRHNPCRIRGAGREYSRERPVVPVGTLVKLPGVLRAG